MYKCITNLGSDNEYVICKWNEVKQMFDGGGT